MSKNAEVKEMAMFSALVVTGNNAFRHVSCNDNLFKEMTKFILKFGSRATKVNGSGNMEEKEEK